MSVSDLTNTKWLFNESFGIEIAYFYYINFISNNSNFTEIIGDSHNGGQRLYYDNTLACSVEKGEDYWKNQAYRTIEITGGTDTTNPTLIAWLQANATQIQSGHTLTIDGTDYTIDDNTSLLINSTGLYNSTTSTQVWTYSGDTKFLGFATSSGGAIVYDINDTITLTSDLTLYSVEQARMPLYIDGERTDKYHGKVVNKIGDYFVARYEYSITTSVTNGTYSGSTSILVNDTATVTITADSGYDLPSSVTVTGASYSYSNGVISLSNPTGDVTISVVCEAQQSGPTPKASLSDYTWAEIKELADLVADQTLSASDLSNTYHIAIGDTKSSTINGETHSYRLIGLRHDVDASDNYLGMTFEQVDLMANDYAMKSSMTSSDNWNNSDLKTTINAFTIASDLDAVITAAKKPCAYNVSSGTPLTYVISKLWVESETEVFNTQNYTISNTIEGSQYQYYANGGSTIKQKSGNDYYWWLRSPYFWRDRLELSYFAYVDDSGDAAYHLANDTLGVAPCFCI